MGSYEYLSVFISILVGLAVTHLVLGMVSIIQERSTCKVYWVHLLWGANGISCITQAWWFLHSWDSLESWTMSIFYLLFIYSMILTAFVGLLFPIHGAVTDYRAYFYANSRWFFGLQFLWLCLDVVEVTTKAAMGVRPVHGDYFELTIPILLGLLLAVFVKNAKYHGFLALAVFFLVSGLQPYVLGNNWLTRAQLLLFSIRRNTSFCIDRLKPQPKTEL